MLHRVTLVAVVICMTGCQSIVASSSKDYYYNGNVYIRSVSDELKGNEKALSVCKSKLNVKYNRNLMRARIIQKEDDKLIYTCYLVTEEENIRETVSANTERMNKARKKDEEAYANYLRENPGAATFKPAYESNVHVDEDGVISGTTRMGDATCSTLGSGGNISTICN
ncbi:hypothetical protein [Yersinia kristensenii]|uniref:hypothetical protein n=1 Tax=Yersinia kristensenii TaxID=28152 RepID=UPI0011A95740|nr:hypothetical protein [Yersinia kristensenii]